MVAVLVVHPYVVVMYVVILVIVVLVIVSPQTHTLDVLVQDKIRKTGGSTGSLLLCVLSPLVSSLLLPPPKD